ncbi:MAG: hypothetical protein NXH75_07335 [Halobacteriovoraceae bacterium]|nr:hypothetical protein [Halobacteriovoraceae bacterium]
MNLIPFLFMLLVSNSIFAMAPKDYDGTMGEKKKREKEVKKERNPSSTSKAY